MADAGRLQAWVRQQIETGLPAFAGARVTGSVPVQVSLLNDLIAQALADAAAGGTLSGGTPGVDADVPHHPHERCHVDAAPGVITLDFEVGVGG